MAQTRPPGRDPSRLRTPALFFPNSGPALITSRVSVFFFCFSLIFTTHHLLPLMRNLTQTITNIPPSKIRKSYHWDRNKRGRERGNKRHRETEEERDTIRNEISNQRVRYDAVGIVCDSATKTTTKLAVTLTTDTFATRISVFFCSWAQPVDLCVCLFSH